MFIILATITDPYNPILGILFESGLDHHFDRHEISIYANVSSACSEMSNVQDTTAVLHAF